MILKKDIEEILNDYDKEKIVICTIGSHTALQIAKGARDENFSNLLLCVQKSEKFYNQFDIVDDVMRINSYEEILDEEIQDMLIERNSILIPHGSFVEYVGSKNIIDKLKVPMHGNRLVLEWESDRKKEREWFEKSKLRVPREFKSPDEIDSIAIVKFPGARGGGNYFIVKNEDEFYEKIGKINLPKEIKERYTIQEYVIGTRFYPHFFYSALDDRVELLGMDIRYESNVDGISRIPAVIQNEIQIEPSYVITGNIPVVMRESLLPELMEIARNLINSSKKLFRPGLIGPFCVELVLTDDLEFVCFEISARIVAGTNLFINGSPYSSLIYNEPMSMGRRICRDIRIAIKSQRLDEIIY